MEASSPRAEKKQKVEENLLSQVPDDVHRIISSFYHWRPPIFHWRIFWKLLVSEPKTTWLLGVDIMQDHGLIVYIPFRVYFYLPFDTHITKKTVFYGEHSWELEIKEASIWIYHCPNNWKVDGTPFLIIPTDHPQCPEFLSELKFTIKDIQDSMWDATTGPLGRPPSPARNTPFPAFCRSPTR